LADVAAGASEDARPSSIHGIEIGQVLSLFGNRVNRRISVLTNRGDSGQADDDDQGHHYRILNDRWTIFGYRKTSDLPRKTFYQTSRTPADVSGCVLPQTPRTDRNQDTIMVSLNTAVIAPILATLPSTRQNQTTTT